MYQLLQKHAASSSPRRHPTAACLWKTCGRWDFTEICITEQSIKHIPFLANYSFGGILSLRDFHITHDNSSKTPQLMFLKKKHPPCMF